MKYFSVNFCRKVNELLYLQDYEGFIRFCSKFLRTNGGPFNLNWHQKLLAKALIDGDTRLVLALLFRGYGKTQVVGAYCVWMILKYREISILYVTSQTNVAVKCVSFVKDTLCNPAIIAAFGDYKGFPDGDDRTWGKKEFVVVRKTIDPKMPTMSAQVLTGRELTGRRAHITIGDDLTNTANTRTSQERNRVIEAFHTALWPIANGVYKSEYIPFFPKRIIIGTPYAIGDLLHKMSEDIKNGIYNAIKPVFFNQGIYNEDGEIAFSHLDKEQLEADRLSSPDSFVLNYLCTYSVLEGERIINPKWIQYISHIPEEYIGKGAWIVTTDAAFSKTSRADRTVYTLGYFVAGKTSDLNKYFVVHSSWGKFSSPEAPAKLKSFLETIKTRYGVVKPPILYEGGKEMAFWDFLIVDLTLKDIVGKWIKIERAKDVKEFGEGKIARGTKASTQFEKKNVFFFTTINAEMINEVTSQTSSSTKQHDDFFDTVVDFVNYAPKKAKNMTGYKLPTSYTWMST